MTGVVKHPNLAISGEGPLWVEGGPSWIVRKLAAVGGQRSFAPDSRTWPADYTVCRTSGTDEACR